MPMPKSTGLKSPVNGKLENPLTNGEKTKKLKEMHKRNLAASGLREPKSPI